MLQNAYGAGGLGPKVTSHRVARQEESSLHVFSPLGECHWIRNRHPGLEQHWENAIGETMDRREGKLGKGGGEDG